MSSTGSDARAVQAQGQARDGNGRFDRDPEVVMKDAEAAKLRAKSWTYQQIADHLGMSRQGAYDAVKRILDETVQEPSDDVRKIELERLDHMAQAVEGVLERQHVVVSNGRIIGKRVGWELNEDGTDRVDADGHRIPIYQDLEDDAPVLQAVDRLLKIQERRSRLLGLDAPQRVSVDAENLGREIVELFTGMAGAE